MRRFGLVGVLVGLGAGCAGCAGAPPRARKIEAVASDPSPSSYVSPARWDFHPPTPTTALAGAKLADGRCLFTSEGGVRWISETAKLAGSVLTCSGAAEASAAVAPDDLTTLLRRDGAWLFVTDGGDMYEAPEPLAPFTRSTTAPEPFVRVAVVGADVVGATLAGRIARWDAVRGWAPSTILPGLEKARIFDLAAGPNDRVLALGFPEALFASEDAGRTFHATKEPTIGARRLGRSPAGDVGAQGILESSTWRTSGFARSRDHLLAPAPSLAVEVGRSASVNAVQTGRAVIEGDRYYEFFRDEPEGHPWTLARGRIEGHLEVGPIEGTEPCTSLNIGARGSTVVISCARPKRDEDQAVAVDVRVSEDAGRTWAAAVTLSTPDSVPIWISVSGRGSALIAGACKAGVATPCVPGAPFVLSRVGGGASVSDGGASDAGGHEPSRFRVLPASVPQLTSSASAPSSSLDGRSMYFVGKRGKDERFGLFVSHDGGATFAPRSIDEPSRGRVEEVPEGENAPPRGLDIDETTLVRAAEDGTLGFIAMRDKTSYVYVVADEDGRVLQVATAPIDEEGNPVDVLYGGVGRRVLATAFSGSSPPGGAVWESLDGGATWERVAAPPALGREYGKSNVSTACSTGGCLVGDTVSRVGWGGVADGSPSPAPADTAPTPDLPPPLAITCEIAPSSRWTRIEDVVPTPGGVGFPAAREMMRGRSVWSVSTRHPITSAITAVEALAPERGAGEAAIVRHTLLGPAPPHTATALSPDDAEGHLAVRVTYPVDKAGKVVEKGALRGLEIAWTSMVEGVSGHARVPDVGVVEHGDITVYGSTPGDLHPEVLAVRGRGVVVHPHAKGTSRDALFADVSGKVDRFTAPTFPRTSPVGDLEIRRDGAVVDREVFEMGFAAQDGATRRFTSVLTGKRAADGSFSLTADALVPSRAPEAVTFWTASRPPGLVTFFADAPNKRVWGHFLELRADGSLGPPEPAPTLVDLGPRPRACTADERAHLPRIVLPSNIEGSSVFEGSWPTITVTEPLAKGATTAAFWTLATNGVVLHGKPGAACFAAWAGGGAGEAGAAIPAAMTRSWFFRRGTEEIPAPVPRTAQRIRRRFIEARPMSCHWEPTRP